MEVSRRLFLKILGAASASLSLKDFVAAQERTVSAAPKAPWFAPQPPPFPGFNDRNVVIAEANRISSELENYIRDWFDGKVSSELPERLIPSGVDREVFKTFRLQRAEDVRPEEQWGIREAEEIKLDGLRGQFPDPHCTYLVVPTFFAPFGSRLAIEGEFPHSRFFDVQVTPSFHPEAYHYAGWAGVGEVPLVDADIEPLPGHTNPFRVGANRNAKRRGYRVEYDLAIGNPAELNRAFRPPYYRGRGNRRIGGSILYQGPWGDPKNKPWGHGRGLWDIGQIWLRYYAPDKPTGALGGVPLPKVYYELSNGRRFFINSNLKDWERRVNIRRPASDFRTWPSDPPADSPAQGWNTQLGIFRAIYSGFGNAFGASKEYIRALDLGVTGRGENQPVPNNYEPSATTCTYINYLNRGMNLGWFKVIVITGKLPITPRTRGGEPTMEAAEARYWSLTSYSQNLPDKNGFGGAAVTSIMDDELVLDENRRYIIAYSWGGGLYRPRNARAENGVTWRDWSLITNQSWTLRWLSVHPEWSFKLAPNEQNLGWKADWASESFNRNLISNNNQNGFLREYQPIVHYMTKGEFEALGDGRIDPARIPIWR